MLSQRLRIVHAARLRADIIDRHGDRGAFPSPRELLRLDLDLPGRKGEYLHAVAAADIGVQLQPVAGAQQALGRDVGARLAALRQRRLRPDVP